MARYEDDKALPSKEEIAEIRELFPKLSDDELHRFIAALDCSIDQVLDSYFKLGAEDA